MALLPPRDVIQEKIESIKHWDNRPRSYLGYSGMASPCQRYLKYSLHWCFKTHHDARVERIFRRGDYEEIAVQRDFEAIGIEIFDDQLEVSGGHGYAKGHIDGKVQGVPGYELEILLLEVKTMNDKRFKEYIKKGLQEVHPVYYGQIQSYMGKLGLANTLYVVTNKNDESRNYQVLPFDESKYQELEDVANTVPLMDALPDKIGGKTWFTCKYCNARQTCHYDAKIRRTCRSCAHVTLEGDGNWGCTVKETDDLQYDDQLNGCKQYELDEIFER